MTPKPLKVLIVADPLENLKISSDSSLRILENMFQRSEAFEPYYLNYSKLNEHLESSVFLASLKAQKVIHCDLNDANFVGLGVESLCAANDFDVILLRQDPPVDQRFHDCCMHFAKCSSKVLFINHPKYISTLKEHIIPTDYPEFSIPTFVCHSYEDLVTATRTQKPEAVLKPENESSGKGITFVKPDCDESILKEFYKKYGPTVIVQPYLDEITKSGDLRVLYMNERFLGAVLRVPQKGSRLANFYQGGTGAAQTPTKRQMEISKFVAEDLSKKGIFFVGFDFIGEHLSEVNITSPTGIAQINSLYGLKIENEFNDEIIKLWDKK